MKQGMVILIILIIGGRCLHANTKSIGVTALHVQCCCCSKEIRLSNACLVIALLFAVTTGGAMSHGGELLKPAGNEVKTVLASGAIFLFSSFCVNTTQVPWKMCRSRRHARPFSGRGSPAVGFLPVWLVTSCPRTRTNRNGAF